MTTTTNIASTNWSGAVMTAGSGQSFSTVSAEWVVPTLTQVPIKGITTSDIAQWVGIDGYNSSDVAQAGVLQVVSTVNGKTTVTTQAFDEWYPASANLISSSTFAVNPGNTIKVSVETTGAGATHATFVFDDLTTGHVYTTSLTAPTGTSLQGNSAEFIAETPEWSNGIQVTQPLLSDFLNAPITFQDVDATYKTGATVSLASAQSIGVWSNEVPGDSGTYVQEAYGSIHSATDSITVTENAYWNATELVGDTFGPEHLL
jgi:hypothetical protein